MNKILSISVAAYNVEKYLEKTLDSCAAAEVLDDIEVIVVDDGSKDETATIASKYVSLYPDSFRLIKKENGGYGTTVNTSIKTAKGVFFKLLDGDDWLDTNGLNKLVSILRSTDADMVFNGLYKEYPDREEREKDTWENYIGKKIPVQDIKPGIFAGMWEITIRTSVLKHNWVDLPEKLLYTDHFYLMQTIYGAKDALFLDFPVYCYRLGNESQSVSIESRKKHIKDIVMVSDLVSNYYHDYCRDSANHTYAKERARFTYMEAHRALLLLPCNLQNMRRLKQFDRNLKNIDRDIYLECVKQGGKKSLLFLRYTLFWGYWIVVAKNKLRAKLNNC